MHQFEIRFDLQRNVINSSFNSRTMAGYYQHIWLGQINVFLRKAVFN